MLEKIGTTKEAMCYDGKIHLTELTDYLIKLTGNTYHSRAIIHRFNELRWDADDKAWFGNFETEERINELYQSLKGTGVKIEMKPIYRICRNK